MTAKQFLYTLRRLELSMNLSSFYMVFGLLAGDHLYKKWTEVYDGNLLTFYMSLDSDNAKRLEDYIEEEV